MSLTTHHVEDSSNGSYPFAVKEGAKSDATIIVTAATNAAVSETIESGDKAKIEAVKDKATLKAWPRRSAMTKKPLSPRLPM